MPSIVVASYLEEEHLERIRSVDPRVHVHFDRSLVPPPRYDADHVGDAFRRTSEQEQRWRTWLRDAEILFDFDRSHGPDLPDLAPRLRWIQGTSAGIGQYVLRNNYHTRMPDVIFTTASGVHAKPLAEYAMMSMLMFTRGLFRVLEFQQRRAWERYAGTDLHGRTLLIIGLGAIGQQLAHVARPFGLHVIGIKRHVSGVRPDDVSVDELYSPAELERVLPRADFLVLIAPHTSETEHMINADRLSMMKRGAVIINIGRGQLVEESALIDALKSGHLGGASLDVFETEPLPNESPLWDMPNVLVSPHSGSTSDRENGRITDIFCKNITRYLAGETLINAFDATRSY